MSPVQTVQNDTKKRTLGGLPYPIPLGRRCKARNRQGGPCGCWTIRGKAVCKQHGDLSRGPSKAGRRRIRQARTIHGKYSLDALKVRLLKRLRSVFYLYFDDPARGIMRPEDFARYREGAWDGYLRRNVLAMNNERFRAMRKHLVAFCHGKITFLELDAHLDRRSSR